MKDRYSRFRDVLVASAMLSLVTVPGPAGAFKIPGIPMAGGQSAAPASGRGVAGVGHRPQGGNGEYMGPVFIIRELDKDAELYDAFITTGGIHEANPPVAVKGGYAGGQQTKSGRPAPAAEEDSEYFGVLVTPETVRQLRFPKGLYVNASLNMLLNAASSRMPWLLVLRRSSHSELSMGGGDKGASQSTPPPQAAADQAGGISPNMMQVPQRRRYYGGSDVRQRRRRGAVDFRFSRPLSAAATDQEVPRSVPLMLEREVLSTMCYNFAREFYQTSTVAYAPAASAAATYWDDEEPLRGHRDARLDVKAYAAAAARYETSSPEPEPQEPDAAAAAAISADVPMTVPKRVS